MANSSIGALIVAILVIAFAATGFVWFVVTVLQKTGVC